MGAVGGAKEPRGEAKKIWREMREWREEAKKIWREGAKAVWRAIGGVGGAKEPREEARAVGWEWGVSAGVSTGREPTCFSREWEAFWEETAEPRGLWAVSTVSTVSTV